MLDRVDGFDAAFFGWLAATGMAVLLTALVAGAGTALGYTNDVYALSETGWYYGAAGAWGGAGDDAVLRGRGREPAERVGRFVRGAGKIAPREFQYDPATNEFGVSGARVLVAQGGLNTMTLAPGVKWNLWQGALLSLALTARGDIAANDPVPAEFLNQAAKWVVMHEVGHTLGLAHNYISHVYGRASVMDYPGPLVGKVGGAFGAGGRPGGCSAAPASTAGRRSWPRPAGVSHDHDR